MNRALLSQARKLSLEEQLELVQAIWDDIVERGAVPPLTAAQSAELDRRLADHRESPEDVVPWTEVRAAALAHLRR
jgi:putative addiction module component (TIGR02574 family)